jgi:hypothetical protein
MSGDARDWSATATLLRWYHAGMEENPYKAPGIVYPSRQSFPRRRWLLRAVSVLLCIAGVAALATAWHYPALLAVSHYFPPYRTVALGLFCIGAFCLAGSLSIFVRS